MVAGENIYHIQAFSKTPYGLFYHNPGYPLLIAGFMVFGFDAEQAARIIPILCFALLVFPLFFLAKKLGGVITGYIACLISLALMPLLSLATWAWTDMPYIFFSTLALYFLVDFTQSGKTQSRSLFLGAIAISAATLMRFIGVTLVLLGLLAIVLKNVNIHRNRRSNKKIAGVALQTKFGTKVMFKQILVFGLVSFGPIFLYLCRNFLLTGRFAEEGFYGPAQAPLSQTIPDRIHWVIATTFQQLVLPRSYGNFSSLWDSGRFSWSNNGLLVATAIAVVGILLLVVCVKTSSAIRNSLGRHLVKHWVLISYIFVYLGTLVATGAIWYSPKQWNYVVPPYPFIIVVIVSIVVYASKVTTKRSLRLAFVLLIPIVIALFIATQASTSLSYSYDLDRAEFGRGLNSPAWRNEVGMAWMASNVPVDAAIYSDQWVGVWFTLKRPILSLPLRDYRIDAEELFDQLESDKNKNSYIISFKGEYYGWGWNRMTNAEIAQMNESRNLLVVVADFPTSTIWHVNKLDDISP